MKKINLLIFFTFLGFQVSAQKNVDAISYLSVHVGDSVLSQIYGDGRYELNSNAITSKLFTNYVFSTFLTKESLESSRPKLHESNRYSINNAGGLMYVGKFNRSLKLSEHPLLYYIGWRDIMKIGCRFSEDAYKLVAFGNADYAGETAHFSTEGNPANYQKMRFQKLYGGIIKTFGEKKSWVIGGGLGIVGGLNYIQADFRDANLYTSLYGDSIYVNLDMDYIRADQQPGYFNFKGVGASADFFLKMPTGNSSTLSFSISNLGFMHWPHDGREMYLDSHWPFTGSEANIKDGKFSLKNFVTFPDSIAKLMGDNFVNKPLNVLLPPQLSIVFRKMLKNNTNLNIGMEDVLFYHVLPTFYVISDKSWYAKNHSSFINQYNLELGLQYSMKGTYGIYAGGKIFIKDYFLSLGTSHLEALVASKYVTGQGAFFSVGKLFSEK